MMFSIMLNWYDQVENEYREEAGLKGWYYKAKNLTEKDMKFGSMSIATTNESGISRKEMASWSVDR